MTGQGGGGVSSDNAHARSLRRNTVASPVTSSACKAMLIQSGDSATHHQDQVITPVSLSTIGATTTTRDNASWMTFQRRSAAEWGSFTRTVNTTPA